MRDPHQCISGNRNIQYMVNLRSNPHSCLRHKNACITDKSLIFFYDFLFFFKNLYFPFLCCPFKKKCFFIFFIYFLPCINLIALLHVYIRHQSEILMTLIMSWVLNARMTGLCISVSRVYTALCCVKKHDTSNEWRF